MDRNRERRAGEPGPSASLTLEAHERLKAEHERLTTAGRLEMAERLERAREHGDIRENAEYDAAKNEQALMESRIRELERMLRDPEIIEAPPQATEAAPGLVVILRPLDEDEDGAEEERYLLAASKEERIDGARTVSIDSPLGQVLVGRKPGEEVSYMAPGGTFTYEVVRLEPRPA